MSPGEVVREAAEVGLDVLALTDHDTADGWDEAIAAADDCGIGLVLGMEVSCTHAGASAHLLAYLPDPTYPPLAAELVRILEGRDRRMPLVLARLRELGIDLAEEEVRRQAEDAAAIGRPHIADALVAKGEVADRDEAFDRYLKPGRPAYVERYAPELDAMIRVVREAGGAPVLAHPWGRTDTSPLQLDGIAHLRDAGLVGIEVDHEDHDREDREQLRGIAAELGLVATGSSDFHGSGKVSHELGCNTTAPDEFERLIAEASALATASGRATPPVVRRA